ncbi:hypothetical protein NC651_040452 [Populus alba x Populus x berolinensis]|nr:hypothetical protein NC651_040452 [Populus alba x Populus x berolinensis]
MQPNCSPSDSFYKFNQIGGGEYSS